MFLWLAYFYFRRVRNVPETGGSSSGSTDNGNTVINFWYTWGGVGQTAMQQLIDEFNKSQNKIIVKGLALGDEQKEMTAIVGHNPPDIASQYDENNVASWASKEQ